MIQPSRTPSQEDRATRRARHAIIKIAGIVPGPAPLLVESVAAEIRAAREEGWIAAEDYYGLDHNSQAMRRKP